MILTEKQLLQIVVLSLAMLAGIELWRELRAVKYRRWQADSHKHQCRNCGSVWDHRNDTAKLGNPKAHICPRCGAEQREKSPRNIAEFRAKVQREAGARFLEVDEVIRVSA